MICDDPVCEDSYSLQYVPDWFVTRKMCDNMADDDYCYNNDELVEWYNGYKQRKVQRAQTKEDFMPNA